jgi:ApbE superfamily uncharacterized protein (UPF0280 family)
MKDFSKEFHIYYTDRSVGIEVNAKVKIEDNFIWDEDMVEHQKQILAEFYQVRPKFILTKEEVDIREESYRKIYNLENNG